MLYGKNFDGLAEIVKADAVVPDTETKLRRFHVPKALNIAFSRSQESGQSVKDAEGRSLIDSAEVGPGLADPNNLLRHLFTDPSRLA
jgi:hypothetical protein